MATRLTRRALIASAPGLYLASKGAGRAYAQEKTIKVGVIQPMSGNLSPYSQEGQPAFEYIVKKINAEGGIKSMGGAKIQLVIADDASQPARTASEARRLISQGALRLNDDVVTELDVPRERLSGALVQAGKRRFLRLTDA